MSLIEYTFNLMGLVGLALLSWGIILMTEPELEEEDNDHD